MHIASITRRTKPVQGFVTHTDNLQVAVHCQFDGERWEPLFGIKRGVGRIGLPACFSLDDESQAALTAAMNEDNDDQRRDAVEGRR